MTRFVLRWDKAMGCYRVSEPNIEGPVEVVTVRAIEAQLDDMELHEDLPNSFDMGYMQAWRDFRDWLAGT